MPPPATPSPHLGAATRSPEMLAPRHPRPRVPDVACTSHRLPTRKKGRDCTLARTCDPVDPVAPAAARPSTSTATWCPTSAVPVLATGPAIIASPSNKLLSVILPLSHAAAAAVILRGDSWIFPTDDVATPVASPALTFSSPQRTVWI
ncbi:hypothetical protein BS78_07G226700 [Paspalum vaginatum]|nr:hypothetical protein BS78_07G226700 [Paspalum vaginatum]